MSKQKNILNFFKPVVAKRPSFEIGECSGISKKPKLDDGKENNQDQGNTYEDKSKITLASVVKEFSLVDKNMGISWFYALQSEFKKPYFKSLNEYIETEREVFTIYPARDDVWAWTKFCPISKIKVVILGQDPYHNRYQAHGLSFSVPKGVQPPPSLLNMYKELKDDIEDFVIPAHGDLTSWAKQGVLLLNACLTVRQNSPNSHADKGWENMTNAVIKYISDKNKGVVFLLWGSYAQKKAACVDQKKHHLLKTAHPSPLSAHRGFFGCKHFSKCNKLLEEEGKEQIDWNSLNKAQDIAKHTLLECGRWGESRAALFRAYGTESLTLANILGEGCENEEKWRAFSNFCKRVIRQKTADERKTESLRRHETSTPVTT